MNEATLKKIHFNEVDGVVWIDRPTFATLVNFYLEGHPMEAEKIDITAFTHDKNSGNA